MRKYFLLTIGCLLLLGCKQEVLEPEQMIQGKFALDDGSGLTNEYLEFANGHLNIYEAPLFPFAEGKIWHTDGWEFMNTHDDHYTISEGNIYTSSTLSGPIALKDGILTVGGKKYAAMEGFEAKSYSKIVAESEVTFPYTDQDFSIPYSIERPIPAGDAGVSTNNSQWITNLKVEDGAITGHLSATSANRSGSIKLSYTHATDVWVTVKQAPTTFIRPTPESLTLKYTASTQTLDYTIENPVATSTLTANSTVSWISDLQVSGTQISFNVSENNTGANRSGSITLRYVGAPDVSVPVTQKWSASNITMAPSSQTVDYTGGSFSFDYAICNPREGVLVTVASQVNWITNVAVSGNTISYQVAENNSGAQRTGKIKLTYGNYASAEFPVTQSWTASSITMTPSSQTADYTGGSFNFSYAISNPRANTTVTAASQVNWITNVAVSGNSISYKVAENNSGTQRSGKIKLTYGSYVTAEFTVTQSWTASSITITPSSQTADYTGGSFNFSYAVSNPRTNAAVTATSQNDWITDVAMSGNIISYKVAESNSGAQRTGKIKLTYGTSYATTEFTVTQTGKPVVLLTLNKSELALLFEASETLIATVDPTDAPLQWSSNKTSVATVDQNGKVTAVSNGTATISVIAGEKTAQCTVTVTTAVKGVSLNKTTLNLNVGESETLEATITPSSASNQSVTWISDNPSAATVDQSGKVEAIASGTALITVKTVDGNYTATCRVTVRGTPAGAVDLGLSVYWATSNLSSSGFCTNPQDYGDYYAWGETAPKSTYFWSTYKWCNGSNTSFTRYCPSGKTSYWGGSGSPDNKTTFKDYDYADDAARKVLGGKWRTPTDDEWTELRNNCTWVWTDNYNGTGVKGRVVTASNGNSIFLPAAGYRSDSSLSSAGSYGYYWSSSLCTDGRPNGAWGVFFYSDGVYRDGYLRCRGFSVRPVSE